MRGELADVREGEVAFTPENHRAQIAAAARRGQRPGVRAVVFVHEMREGFQVRQQVRVQGHGEFVAGLALRVGERAAAA